MQKQREKRNPQVFDIPDSSFGRLLEISPTGIYITDIAGKCLYVNPVWCRMSGLTVVEAKGDGWLRAIHPDDRERINSGWKQFINGDIPWSYEYRFINQEGKITWVFGTADRFSQKNGLKEGVIGVNHDITERKDNETRLKVSEEKYRTFFENSIDAILLTSPDGKIYSANPAACKMFERSEEEICKIGRDGVVDKSDPNLYKALKKRSDTGSYFGELMMVRKSGEKFPVELSTAIFSGSDGNLLTTMIIRDITVRKNYEERLKASEAEFRSIFENSLMGISQARPGGGLIRINKAYAELYGYPDIETMVNEAFPDTKVLYSNPDDRERVLKILEKTGYMAPSEFELKKRNGEKFWALVSARQVRDNSGNLNYLQAEHIDITELKKMEADLRKSKVSLENLNHHLNTVRENERSQIAMNLHDDLGQRLTSLNLDLAWLKSRMGVQSIGVRKKMQEMSSSIIETVESIREVSSFLRPIILYELGLVSAFSWQLKKFEKQTGIKLHFTHEPEDFRIDDNVSLIIYRVLQESLTNIIRHSEASKVEISLVCKRNLIHLSITDNGVGIDKDKINSVTSMGIAGLRERVRSVNGTLSITGKVGSGTTIKVSIPLKKNKNHDKSTDN